MNVWIIGSGYMAQEYVKVLIDLEIEFSVLCRTKKSALGIEKLAKNSTIVGDIKQCVKTNPIPEYIINAVSIDALFETSMCILNAGCKNVLIEKPGALYLDQLNEMKTYNKSNVFIGYNRRFYPSVNKLRDLLKEDGPLSSCRFEFTEWPKAVLSNGYSSEILKNWVLANSSHVIDLFIFLCGYPEVIKSFQNGALNWHKRGAQFSGAGITELGVTFSYHADWNSYGRWGVELMTSNNKYVLQPLEQLKFQKKYSTKTQNIDLQQENNTRFKPGLYQQTRAFLNGDITRICTLSDHIKNTKIYNLIAGYK